MTFSKLSNDCLVKKQVVFRKGLDIHYANAKALKGPEKSRFMVERYLLLV